MSAAPAHVIDCDVHVAVPSAQALAPYLPAHWQAYVEEASFRAAPGPSQVYPPWSPLLATRGAELTLEALQRDLLGGLDRAVLQCYYGVEGVTHPYFAPALATAVNDWLAAEFLDRDERLLASAAVAPQFADSAAAEVRRIAADERFVQLLVPVRSLEPYGNPRYWPIWEAAAEHGLTIGLTPGGSAGSPPTPTGWLADATEEYAAAPLAYQTQITSLVVSGIFQRLPQLRVVVMESGWTWLPALLWRMDLEWKAARREVPWLSVPPSQIVRRHFRFTTQPFDAPADREQRAQMVRQLGSAELLMFGSDHPHAYGGGQAELLEVLDDDAREAVLWGNAAELYGLDRRRSGAVAAGAERGDG